jgi:phage tail sheath gpL-like
MFVIAPGNTATTYSTDKAQMFSAQQAGETYGFGSPIHRIVLRMLPPSGDGVGDIPVTVYPLVDGTTASAGTITPAGSPTANGTYRVLVNNIPSESFELLASASVADATAAITAATNAVLDMPTTAADGTTVVNFTAKWQGASGDNINLAVEGPSLGMTFGIVQHTGGGADATPGSTQFDQFGDDWETLGVQSNGGIAATLNAISDFNEGRWDPTVSRPILGAFYASTETDVATAIALPDSRTTDRTNSQLDAPGCLDLPWEIAARKATKIARVANSTSPASDYVRQVANGLTPGPAAVQWSSAQRDTAVKAGASTSEVRGGQITISDTVTMFHPVGDPTPAYRYVNDLVKLANMLNDLRIVFDSPEWAGAPLVPNGQAVTDRSAKRPKMAEAAVKSLIDSWGLRALISDPATAKDTVVANINGSNPRRLDIAFTIQLSGNANIISVDMDFGFFFGQAAVI